MRVMGIPVAWFLSRGSSLVTKIVMVVMRGFWGDSGVCVDL
jgi:hypothetical protein